MTRFSRFALPSPRGWLRRIGWRGFTLPRTLPFGWRLATGSWRLATGDWRLATGSWRLTLTLALILALSLALVGAPPQRIVSLVPNVTEMLFAIGAGDRVIGVSSFDQHPPEVKTRAKVGGLLDPDLERIFALRPDLAVIYGSQKDLGTQLERAGVGLYLYRHGGVKDVTRTMRELGERLGLREQAEKAARAIEAGLEGVRKRVAGRPKPRVLLVFGRERGALRSIHASGGRGFLHDLVEIGGGEDVFADIDRESVQASTELILARSPDVIVEVYGAGELSADTAARERAAWSPLSAVPAVRNGRVYVLSGQELVVAGPRIVRAAERIARAIHP